MSAADDVLADELLTLSCRIQQHKLQRSSRQNLEHLDSAADSEEKRQELTIIEPFVDLLPELFNSHLKHCGLTRSHLRPDERRRFTVF